MSKPAWVRSCLLLLSLVFLEPARGDAALAGNAAVPEQSGTDVPRPKGPVADNRRCFVCHANYDFSDEKLAFTHAQANIGCVACHGESSRHSADEDGLTPPDRMWPPSHIRINCLLCHDWMRLIESDQNKTDRHEPPDHQAVLDGTTQGKKLCTDCHGEHRLPHRTRTWNKRTGKLLYRDATPAMLSEPPGPTVPRPANALDPSNRDAGQPLLPSRHDP